MLALVVVVSHVAGTDFARVPRHVAFDALALLLGVASIVAIAACTLPSWRTSGP
jgi:hypothetical protein